MEMILLKNADTLQTIEITYDGLYFNGKQIQYGVLQSIKAEMEFKIGRIGEAIEYILSAVNEKGFKVYSDSNEELTTIGKITFAVDSLEKPYSLKPKYEYPKIFEPVEGQIYINKNGSSYLCRKVEHDQYGKYTKQAEFVSRSGWYLTADCPRQYKDGRIEWDSSYRGHFIEVAEAQEMFTQAEKSNKLAVLSA